MHTLLLDGKNIFIRTLLEVSLLQLQFETADGEAFTQQWMITG